MKLFRSNDDAYLYVMRINHLNKVYFGNPNCFNVVNSSDKRRNIYCSEITIDNLKKEYLECVCREKLEKFNSIESLEFYLLFNKPTLKESIRDYSTRFGVHIHSYSEYYTGQ